MEGGSSEGDRKQNPEGEEPRVKRKTKTAAQLEVLEKTYRVDTFPSESLRAELSVQLGLTDRQLQMWFCHRRLKDRKEPSAKRRRKRGGLPSAATFPLPPALPASALMKKDETGGEFRKEHSSGSGGSGCSPYRHLDPFQGIIPWPGVSGPRISVGAGLGRFYEPPQSISELRAIAFIEVQLGESLREDGPALGMEFDPLPSGDFGAPIVASKLPQKQPEQAYEPILYEQPEAKSVKGPGRVLHGCQVLTEQPTVRNESYKRIVQSHYYGLPPDDQSFRTLSLSCGRSYMHGGKELPVGRIFPGQIPRVSFIYQQGKQGHLLLSTSGQYDGILQKSPCMGIAMDSPFNGHPIGVVDSAVMTSERHTINGEDVAQTERKRKSEEAIICKGS